MDVNSLLVNGEPGPVAAIDGLSASPAAANIPVEELPSLNIEFQATAALTTEEDANQAPTRPWYSIWSWRD